MTIKHEETLSEKLDRKVLEIQKQKKDIETLITSQYEEARKVIGERFIMKKEQDLLFNFFFTGLFDCYDCTLRSESSDINAEFNFEHNVRGADNFLEPREILELPHKIKLTSLTCLLVKWCEILVEYELKKEEKK